MDNLLRPSPQRLLLALIYATFGMVAVAWLLRLDTKTGIAFFFALLLPLFALLRLPNTPRMLYLGFAGMVAGKLAYAETLDTLNGPDALHYYDQVVAFPDLGSFFSFAWQEITVNWANASAYPIYGILYMPFYKGIGLTDPLAIVVFNSVLLVLVAQQTYALCRDHFGYELPMAPNASFYGWIVFGLLVSPSFMFMTSIFAKDTACTLLGLLGTVLLIRRRWILFLLVLLYATGLRDYAIVYTVGYYFLFKGRFKSAVAVLACSAVVVFLFVGVSGFVNAGMLTVFLFMSPNPFNPGNWESATLYRTLEALWMTLSLAAAVAVYAKAPKSRPFYRMSALLLLTYACTLILVGYMTIVTRELDYGVGTIGDNMVRKKLPVLPLLYVFGVYTWYWFGRLVRSYRKENQIKAS